MLFAMISLSACQQAIIESNNIEVSWLFTLIDANDVRYKWSTKDMSTHGEATVWEDGVEWESGVSWDDGLWKAGHLIFKDADIPDSDIGFSVFVDSSFIYYGSDDGLYTYTKNEDSILTEIDNDTTDLLTAAVVSICDGGGFIYTAMQGSGIASYSISAAGAITHVETNDDDGGTAEDVFHDGTWLFVAKGAAGLQSFSVDVAGSFTLEDTQDADKITSGVWADGNGLVFATLTAGEGLYSYTVDGAGDLTGVDADYQSGVYMKVWGDGTGKLFVAAKGAGIHIYTYDGSGNLTFVKNIATEIDTLDVWCDTDYLYAGLIEVGEVGGIRVYEIDGNDLILIDKHNRGASCRGVFADTNNAYSAEAAEGLTVYDIAGEDGIPEYSFRIKDFHSIEMSRPASESSIQMPASVRFTIVDQHDSFTASDFIDGTLWIDLSIEDKTTGMSSIVDRWRFTIRSADAQYKTIKCVAESFFAKYLEGEYPNTQLPKAIFPSDDADPTDNLCVPVPFGTCYIPLRSVYITDDRFYLLGLTEIDGDAVTYTITKVKAPREMGNSEWNSGSYTFTQSTKADGDAVDWRVFQPIINDSDLDGTPDASGLWVQGSKILDMPTQFSRSDTASLTSPEDVIQFVLEDMGVPTALIDVAGTFATAGAVYSGWGLTFNGAFWYKMEREKVLSMLLYMCHSTLIIGETIELHVLSKTSQGTIDSSQVLNTSAGGVGEGTFKYDTIIKKSINDSGHIAWQEADQPQDAFMKALVPAKSTTNNIAGQTLDVPFVQDDQLVQTVGSLVFQRKFLGKATLSFSAMPENLVYRPDDVLTMSGANYGASTTYDFVVEKVRINHDLSVEIEGLVYSDDLDDWADLSPSAITPATDDTAGGWGPLTTTENGVEIYRAGAGTTNLITYQDDALADDGTVNLPDATSGMVFVTCNDEFLICHIKNDGTVKPVMASELTALTDSDTNLCIYDDGTQAIIKNRLGATGETRVFYFYN